MDLPIPAPKAAAEQGADLMLTAMIIILAPATPAGLIVLALMKQCLTAATETLMLERTARQAANAAQARIASHANA